MKTKREDLREREEKMSLNNASADTKVPMGTMLNKTLYLRGIKSLWLMAAIFITVLTLYFVIIISMFDPALGSALNEFAKVMPELMAIVGMNPGDASMISFMSSYLYGFIMLVFPMVFSILANTQLITRHIDKGSMTYLLASPVKRSAVAFTQAAVLISGVVLIVAYTCVLGITAAQISFAGELDIPKFILINAGVLSLQLFIAGIGFIAAVIFNNSKLSLGVGAGIPALCMVLQMASNAGDKFSAIKYATFFTLFDTKGLIAGEIPAIVGIICLFLGAIILFGASIFIFTKKDLHI